MSTLEILDEAEIIDRKTESGRPKIGKPSLYNIIMIDDDITSMQFVCDILEKYFNKTPDQSYDHMMEVHLTGSSNVGIFSKDIAETKISIIHNLASKQEFPLQLKMDKI